MQVELPHTGSATGGNLKSTATRNHVIHGLSCGKATVAIEVHFRGTETTRSMYPAYRCKPQISYHQSCEHKYACDLGRLDETERFVHVLYDLPGLACH
jgi:hypothetical protein